jgi:hypothetical protein
MGDKIEEAPLCCSDEPAVTTSTDQKFNRSMPDHANHSFFIIRASQQARTHFLLVRRQRLGRKWLAQNGAPPLVTAGCPWLNRRDGLSRLEQWRGGMCLGVSGLHAPGCVTLPVTGVIGHYNWAIAARLDAQLHPQAPLPYFVPLWLTSDDDCWMWRAPGWSLQQG